MAGKGQGSKGITGADLLKKKLPERRDLIAGLLPLRATGALSSPPKSMKSYLVLATSCAIANGTKVLGEIPVEPAEVLHLDLEGHARLTRQRLAMMCKEEPAPEGLHLYFDWPRLDEGGLEQLDAWFTDHPKARLLVVDVFRKIAGARKGSTLYESDYNSVEGIRELVQKHDASALLVLHDKKSATSRDDALTRISGSSGLTGAVDVILSLVRGSRGSFDARLFVSGREVSEQELSLRWDPTTGKWGMQDDAAKVMLSLSPERLAIVEYLRSRGTENPAGPKAIWQALESQGLSYASVRQLVRKLLSQRIIRRVRGGYISHIDHKPTEVAPPQQVTSRACDRVEAPEIDSAQTASDDVSFTDFVAARDVEGEGQIH